MTFSKFAARPIVGEFLRFGSVGAVATAIHYSILIVLVQVAQAPLVPSTSIGFTGGAVFSYALNRRITFRHQPAFTIGLAKYVLAGFGGLFLNALIVASLTRVGFQYMLAQMAATAIVLIWNFTVARTIIFRLDTTTN